MPSRTPSQTFARAVRKKMGAPRKRKFFIRIHLVIAAGAILVLSALGLFDHSRFSTQPTKAETTVRQIGIEHNTGATSLSLVMARKGPVGYLAIDNTSQAPVKVSVPEDWKRAEVTNAPLSAMVSDKPEFGFVRWTLPAGAGMKMFTSDVPTSLSFVSPSEGTTAITVHSIDLLTNVHNVNVVLLEKSATYDTLWSAKE